MVKIIPKFSNLKEQFNQVKSENEALRIQLSRIKTDFFRFKSLLTNLQMGVLVENDHREITDVNPAFCELFGIPSQKMLQGTNCEEASRNAADLFIDPEGFIDKINYNLERKETVLNEELELKDGRVFERDFVPVIEEKEFAGNMWIYRDISKQKDKERKLAASNASKDKLFSIISHDLRNPCNAMLSLSDMIVENIKENKFEEVEKQGAFLRQSAKQAVDLISNLMHWSRAQSGRIEYKPERINIKNLVDNILDLSKVSLYEKDISVQEEIKPELEVKGDPFMLELVIRNLISNAIKYTKNRGKIKISAFQSENETNISVSDNGMGLKEEDLNKLFKMEEKFKRPGTNKEKGTGLGLILCKEFIDLHSGTINVDSKEGQGSTFTVTLPAKGKNYGSSFIN